jgi:hypothetical protein
MGISRDAMEHRWYCKDHCSSLARLAVADMLESHEAVRQPGWMCNRQTQTLGGYSTNLI